MSQELQGINLSLIAEVEDIRTFKPRGNRVVIRTDTELAPRTKGGVWLPDSVSDKRRKEFYVSGTVISVGSQVQDLKADDTVFYYTATSEGAVRQGDDIYFLFPDYAIVAVLDTPALTVLPGGEITG